MSTSELRRGPGWWMDLEGQWNPPEEWPESSPPLPGWTRRADGLWTDPVQEDGYDLMTDTAEVTGKTNSDARTERAPTGLTSPPIPDIGTATVPPLESLTAPAVFGSDLDAEHPLEREVASGPVIISKVGLGYSETATDSDILDDDRRVPDGDRHRRRALTAAILAAITASMFSAGLILLLLLL